MADVVPTELLNFLQGEEQRAIDTRLNEQRAAGIRAYQGDKYGDEQEGRSQAVTRDVSEVVDQFVVGILGTVMAGGKAVEFETEPDQVPVMGEDGKPQIDPQTQQPVMESVDYGAEATAAVQYQFFRKQKPKGYRVLHDSLKAGLLEKTGIVKTIAESRAPLRVQQMAFGADIETPAEGISTLGGQQIADAQPVDDPDHDMLIAQGMADMGSRLHAVTVLQPQPPVIKDVPIPNEWFLVSPDAVDLDTAIYVGDRTPKTVSDLVQLGYDYEQVKTIWDNAPADTVVERARDADRSQSRQTIGQRPGADSQRWLNEEYVLWDLDGDGIAERVFVHRIGNNVLKVMPVDDQPYSGWTPVPMQHRFTGQSMADKTGDIQRIRTVLLRQALDSLYLANAPRSTVPIEGMTEDTIDDLLTVRPGALIRYKAGQVPAPFQTTDTSQTAFNAMEMMSNERESRTGITRQSQGMNPDTLNKTATGMAMLQANADQIEVYVAGNFVEELVAPIFTRRYHLMRQYTPPFRMKIDGKYRKVDPSKWPDDIDVTINVGLGTGSKDQRTTYRAQLLNYQQQAIAGGLPGVGPKQIYNNMKALIDDTLGGVATDYWQDPDTLPPQPPKPDPEAEKNQGELMLKQAQQQADQEATARKLDLQEQQQQADAALKQQQNEYDLQAKRESAALDTHLKTQKAQAEGALAVRQQDFEMDLAERRFAFDQEMARKKHAQAAQSDDTISNDRPGGALDE